MPDRLEEAVADFLRRQGIFADAGRALLAISGGADSTALLHILMALKARGRVRSDLVCAHINHRLRGSASDADERSVVEQANRLGLPVVAKAVDVRVHARMEGLSLETAARQLRRASLAEIARDHNCTWVCTGHQKNDSAETVVHHLWRGTGFRGLAGIRPVRWLDGLRLTSPLLCATRDEIVRYLWRHNLHWREDRTNADVAYTRNYIRHQLLPFLQQEAQGCLVEELAGLAISAGKLRARIERAVEEAWPRTVEFAEGETAVCAQQLKALPEPVAVELIRRAVETVGTRCSAHRSNSHLTQLHYAGILRLAGKDMSGKHVSLPNTLAARREGRRIVLYIVPPAAEPVAEPVLPLTGRAILQIPGRTRFAGWEIETAILPKTGIDRSKITGDKSPFCEYLDFDQVRVPIIVRLRQAGDRFQPLGMTGEKKVGKFLTTAKTSPRLRERILILADREKIVWVCPVRLSEEVKVTEKTQRLLCLTVREVQDEGKEDRE